MSVKVKVLGANGEATDWIDASQSLSGQVVFQLSSIGMLTITFEGRVLAEHATDGTPSPGGATAVRAVNQDTGTGATTATANGIYVVSAPAQMQVRARISAYTSGSVEVRQSPSLG